MIKKTIICSLLLLLFISSKVSALEIAISIDDAPRPDGQVMTGRERTDKIINDLSAEGVQAAFYVNTGDWTDDDRARVQSYSDAGHLIANHTSKHGSYHKVGLKQFMKQADEADQLLRPIKNFRPWLRFPYLHEGEDAKAMLAVRKELQKRGYRNGYVTVDTNDWYFDELLQKALQHGDSVRWGKLKKIYFQHLFDSIASYDELAVKTIGRSPRHVILLHENDLNAQLLRDFINEIRAKGWTVVPPDQAYADGLAGEQSLSTFNNNGIIAALADDRFIQIKYRPKWDDTKFIDALLLKERVFKSKSSKRI